jgi:KDO2-lipid IV(A) lauroyltransferase
MYWVHLISSGLLRFIPVRAAYAVVDLFAPIVSRLWGSQYRYALANMHRVLGPRPDPLEVRRQVRNVFRNYARYMVDLLSLPRTAADEVERRFAVQGLENLEHCLDRGRGVVMVTAHIGNWDMAGVFLASRGYPVNVIHDTLHPKRWNDRVQGIRALIGLRLIPVESGVRQMLRALRQNEILAILIDRPMDDAGVPVHFFGAETRVPGGAATLALRAGAPVVCAVALRTRDGFEALVSPIIEIQPSGDPRQDVQDLTQRVMSWLEALIRQHPDQWYMFRNMWPGAATS